MELTLAEFSCFNIKSKQEILQYKAVHIGSISVHNNELKLYSMNGEFIMMHINSVSGKTERIDTVVPKDILYLFAEQSDITGLVN